MREQETQPPSARAIEARRLREEADGGIFAPATGTDFFAQNRSELIAAYVRDGLELYDQQQQQQQQRM